MPNPSTTYASVIANAITDFDSIFDALKAKLVTSSETTVLTTADKSNGHIPTSYYSSFISNQLYRVGTANQAGTTMTGITPTLVNGVIQSYAGENVAGTNGTYGQPTGSNLTITFNIPNPGYYDSTSTITGSVPYNNITLGPGATQVAGFLSNDTYVIQNLDQGVASGVPMLTVTMPKGAATVTWGENAQSLSVNSFTATLTLDLANSEVEAAALTGSSSDYTLIIKKNAAYVASGSITPTVTKTEGYVTASDISVPTPSFNINSNMTEGEETIYIPAGSITGSLDPNAGVTLTTSIPLEDSQPVSGTSYAVTVSTENLNILGTTVGGYVPTNATPYQIGSATDVTLTKYILGGEVPDASLTLAASMLAETDSASILSTTSTAYPITYSIDSAYGANNDFTESITPGYIEDTSYNVHVAGSKTIYVKAGSITQNAGITYGSSSPSSDWSSKLSGDTGIIQAGNSGYYNVSLQINAGISQGSFTPGYISTYSGTGAQVTNNGATSIVSFSVAKGAATITPTLAATLVDRNDDLAGASEDAQHETVEIFQASAPQTGDYYTITAGTEKTSVTTGYMTTNDITLGSNQVLYLPKATFEYVTMGDSEESFLQVTTGGYVPSGMVKEIAPISGTIDEASVTVSMTDGSDGILRTSSQISSLSAGDYYTITAGKGTIDAGYLSSSEGSVSGTTYVLHGGATIGTDVTSTTVVSPNGITYDSTHNQYEFSLNNSYTSTLTFSEGYIKKSDITLNGTAMTDDGLASSTVTVADITSINLARGVFDVVSTDLTAGIDTGSTIELGNSSSNGYQISATLQGTIDLDATTEGYIRTPASANESGESAKTVTIAANATTGVTKNSLFIKKGTGPVARDASHAADNWTYSATTTNASLGSDFASSKAAAESYTVTLGGYADAELKIDTGYYASTEQSLTGGKVYLSKTMTVPHGHASVALTSNSSESLQLYDESTELTLYDSVSQEEHAVRLEGSVTVAGTITVTEGYIKNNSTDKTDSSGNSYTFTKYIKTFSLSTTTQAAGAKNYSGTVSSASATVYNSVTLGSNTGYIDDEDTFATSTSGESGLRSAAIIPTANRYALYDTKVVLTPDAMGSSVVAQMTALERRLQGLSPTVSA